MQMNSRRDFLKLASSAAVCASVFGRSGKLFANPLGLPLGLQLYSVREMLPNDYPGTLKKVAAAGYTEVEAAGFYGHSATEAKQALDAAGLHCVSAHYSWDDLHAKADEILAFGHTLGLQYVICSFPGFKDPARVRNTAYEARTKAFTLEDWRWNAEQFNKMGERVAAAGMKFGYHNHTMEFAKQDGVVPFDELLRLTDPAKVTMEMDCGWVIVGGGSPVEYLRKHANRFSLLHVKDFKKSTASSSEAPPPAAELGQGTIDYRPIFEAAKGAGIRHIFVEQESFDMPPFQSLKTDADYMRNLKV